jgi:imidazoleglycerol-phosphate dehydratase
MARTSRIERKTKETDISLDLRLDGSGKYDIDTGIAFFDHMLTLFSVHGCFDTAVKARGDLEVDFHHTVEDIGLVLGNAIDEALGPRKGIKRYGYAVVPMDEALATVAIDLSKRPYLVYNVPKLKDCGNGFNIHLAKEFFRALAMQGGMNLHINVSYGGNEHHVIEAIFKALGRALDAATDLDPRSKNIPSTKGVL